MSCLPSYFLKTFFRQNSSIQPSFESMFACAKIEIMHRVNDTKPHRVKAGVSTWCNIYTLTSYHRSVKRCDYAVQYAGHYGLVEKYLLVREQLFAVVQKYSQQKVPNSASTLLTVYQLCHIVEYRITSKNLAQNK